MTEEKTHSTSGRVPPQDLVAEKSLLGALILSDAVLPEILTIIKPADFYDKNHQTIFAAISNLYDTHKPIDLLTLTAELKKQKKLKEIGGAPYLTELSNFVPAASHAKAYAEIIEKASIRRRLISAGSEIANKAYEEDADVNTLIGNAEQKLFEVSDKIIKSDYEAIEDLIPSALERIVELKNNKGTLRGLKTGFTDLDKKIAGFQKGDLIIIGARPAMGKTTLAQNLAYNVAKINKKGVLFFSMEMAKNEIVDRIISDVGTVNNYNIRTGNLSDEEFSRIDDAISEIDNDTPIYIDDTSSMTIFDLRNKARRAIHENNNIGMIVLDYLQLIQGTDRYKGNRVQEVTEISRGLKILARELEIPVVALAQLSRNLAGRDDKRPKLSDLRESGSIEQDADLVMFIHRPGKYEKDIDDNITELIIEKHRHGETGIIKLYMEGQYSRFMLLDETHE